MPVKAFRTERSADYARLVSELTEEWRIPGGAQPVILEDRDHQGELNHVYVVWDAWSSTDRVERAEIIMESAEQRYGRHAVAGVTIAMGLTPAEADAMNISWR